MKSKNAYTVTQLTRYIDGIIREDFLLSGVYVKGEVSNLTYHSSGHIYFTMKDEGALINCVCFKSNASKLSFRMDDGDEVIAFGEVGIYPARGSYQLYVREIVRSGVGELYRRFEAKKKELEEMGMFSPEYKKEIPKHVGTIGIATSPTGAVLRDIMNVSMRRNPYIQLVLSPTPVQGEGAAESIASSIALLDSYGVDVIIIGRGGGSMEDLWAFNEEIVAYAIFSCQTPVISAAGHQTDFTIADFVSDLRAPTPSAAAEMATEEIEGTLENIYSLSNALNYRLRRKLSEKRKELGEGKIKLRLESPVRKVLMDRSRTKDLGEELFERLNDNIYHKRTETGMKGEALYSMMGLRMNETKRNLAIIHERLLARSPFEQMNRGYSFVAADDGKRISSVEDVSEDDLLRIYVRDGTVLARILSIEKNNE